MIYAIPVVGWLVGLFLHVSLAIPFWYCWNHLAPTYFYWLPDLYQYLPFWHVVGLFVILSILKTVFLPRFGSVNQQTYTK